MATAGPSKPTVFARVLEVLDTDPPELLLLIEDQVRQYPAPQTPPPPPGTLLPLDQFGKSTPSGKGGQGGFLLANSDSGTPGHLGADALRWRSLGHAPSRMALLRFRQQMLRELRAWFDERDFLEVETPLLVSAPSPEAQFQPFAVTVEGASEPAGFLITSPEFQMKRMLVGGFPRIYQICRCFRGLESGQRHNPEFSMLEWYRAGGTVEDLVQDVEGFISALQHTVSGLCGITPPRLPKPPWHWITVQELFWQHFQLDLDELPDAARLREAAVVQGYADCLGGAESYDDVFFRLWDRLEPELGHEGPLFVHAWPLPLASLARELPDLPGYADRLELYVDGLELANGFGELTDPAEQRRRFESDLKNRTASGRAAVPLDKAFLDSLEEAMPPAAGMALGIERLLMWLSGTQDIREVLAFAWGER